MPRRIIIFLCLCCSVLYMPCVYAAYVTMSQFDINGDGVDDIVRTEGQGDETAIKIYAKIENSYFFQPISEIKIAGNLVQVPNVADFTGDNVCDLYFATGADIGIIYYDMVENTFKRENEINQQLRDPYLASATGQKQHVLQGKSESDIFLQMEQIDSLPSNGGQENTSSDNGSKNKIQTV